MLLRTPELFAVHTSFAEIGPKSKSETEKVLPLVCGVRFATWFRANPDVMGKTTVHCVPPKRIY
jgi:hypothetical protein